MITFLSELIKTAKEVPDRPAVVDMDGKRSTTYKELIMYAKKVNAWLKSRGIGREDVCAIYLQRGVEYIAVRIGIMMAGACCVNLEDLMGRQRIDFVIRDCGCKAVFDKEKWEEAMSLPCCEDIADPDDKDLAFIIYTSGSTGTPKGAAQEYGIYDYISKGTDFLFGAYAKPEPLKFAEVAPQSFVSGIYTTVGIFNVRGTIYEVSSDMIRNVEALCRYFIENGINHTFMTPTFAKLIFNNPSICLRAISIGGEIVSGVYTDRYDIINTYGPSEFGHPTCTFILDRAYDNTPIGYPTCDQDIILLGEDGNPSDEGVFCIRLPFFRGYVGKERGYFIIIDGKEYFKTSDYVRRVDGKYIMLDRIDDMVKINGNRVDTKEVEAAVKRALSLDLCYVKLFVNNGIKSLCAYHTGDKDIDSVEAARILRDYIPQYMIPSCYMRLDEIPLNANGKVDKHSFPEPSGILRSNPYAAPESDLEKKLCDALKKSLVLREDVGIDDDFFMLGGDSIRAMETLADCNIKGLTVQLVYEGRTVRKIIALLQGIDPKPEALSDETVDIPLNIGQIHMLRRENLYPGTYMLNLPFRINISKGADMQRIADALSKTVMAHPALTSTIIQKDGIYYQHFEPEAERNYKVEVMSDEEVEKVAQSFVQTFTLDGEPLFRCRILEGKTKAAILMDAYHPICDGNSLARFIDDVAWAYAGTEPPFDAIRQIMLEDAKARESEEFQKSKEFFREKYDRHGFDTYPKTDFEPNENVGDSIYMNFDFDSDAAINIGRKHGIGKGGLYQAACALAIAAYNDSENIMFTWTWHGRSDGKRMSSVGFFLKDMPICFELKREVLLSKVYEDMAAQIREDFSHGVISYWEELKFYEGKYLTCFLYQGDVREYHDDEGIVTGLEELERPFYACDNILDIEINDGLDEFGVLFDFNAKRYLRSSMERFGRLFCDICRFLISANPDTTTVGNVFAGIGL